MPFNDSHVRRRHGLSSDGKAKTRSEVSFGHRFLQKRIEAIVSYLMTFSAVIRLCVTVERKMFSFLLSIIDRKRTASELCHSVPEINEIRFDLLLSN